MYASNTAIMLTTDNILTHKNILFRIQNLILYSTIFGLCPVITALVKNNSFALQ